MFCLLLTLIKLVASISLTVISSSGFSHSTLTLFSHLTLISLLVGYSLSVVIISATFLSLVMTISLLSILTLILPSNTVYPIPILVSSSHSLPSPVTTHPFTFSTTQYSFRVISTSSHSTSTPLSLSISFYSVVISLMNTLPLSLSSTSIY